MKRSIILIAIFLASCNYVIYTPPERLKTIVNYKHIDSNNFENTWQTLVNNLLANFFQIDHLDKNSGFIQITLSTNDYAEYIEAGTIKEPTFDENDEISDVTKYISRYANPDLTMRVNVILQNENNRLKLTVNAKYIYTVTTRNEYQFIKPTANFTTNSFDYIITLRGTKVIIQPTHKLEQDILEIVK